MLSACSAIQNGNEQSSQYDDNQKEIHESGQSDIADQQSSIYDYGENTANEVEIDKQLVDNIDLNTNEQDGNGSKDMEEIVTYGTPKTIEGYQMVDGRDVPIKATFTVKDVQRGEDAYNILLDNNPSIPKEEEGMDYMIITLDVSYDDGEAEELYLSENYASLESAKLYFALSNGNSNAEQLTSNLSNNIYNLSIQKGESEQGAVAFLHKIGSQEPLGFIGFNNIIKFDLTKLRW